MATNFMAHPELRHPFPESPIHPEGAATVLYQGMQHTLEQPGPGPRLLVRPDDLERINGFQLKPEGACLGDLCYPLPEGMLIEQDGERWLDLEAFADHIGHPGQARAPARECRRARLRDHRPAGQGHPPGGSEGQEGAHRHLVVVVRLLHGRARVATYL